MEANNANNGLEVTPRAHTGTYGTRAANEEGRRKGIALGFTCRRGMDVGFKGTLTWNHNPTMLSR